MGDLLIRNIPDRLKHEIKQAAGQGGESLSDKAIDLLRKGLIAENASTPKRSAWEELRSAFVEAGAVDDEYWKIMNEIEAERKLDFGRPVDFGDPDDNDR